MNIIKKVQKAVAFTLAETLVVMGIIGVVAALTIPNLNQSTGDREKVVKVKKVYANLEDAFGRAQAVYGPFEEWFTNDSDDEARSKRFAERMTEFMKISKNCVNELDGCFFSSDNMADALSTISGNGRGDKETAFNYLLADGTAISLGVRSSLCDGGGDMVLGDASCGSIVVDIDGPKGSNDFGKDMHIFTMYKTDGGVQIYPNIFFMLDSNYTKFNSDSFIFMKQLGTSAWIIKNDNMDYLKADDDGVCPNGTQLSWENGSCN